MDSSLQPVDKSLYTQYTGSGRIPNGLVQTSYTAVNTARSAVSSFVKITGTINIHHDELISRFMREIFNGRPSLPRYSKTWDVKVFLRYLETLDTSVLLSLSCKLCILFLLVTAQRCQTLHVLKLSDICFNYDTVVINNSSILKQTWLGAHQNSIILHLYKLNKNYV